MCEDNEWDEQNIYIYVRACCCAASDAVSRMLQGIWHTTNTPCQKKNVVRNGAEFQAGQQFEGQPVCTINTNIHFSLRYSSVPVFCSLSCNHGSVFKHFGRELM